MDKEIQEELYDPASKKKGSAYLQFVKAHKSWRLPSGLLDLKRIAKAWRLQKKAKGYDPASMKHRQRRSLKAAAKARLHKIKQACKRRRYDIGKTHEYQILVKGIPVGNVRASSQEEARLAACKRLRDSKYVEVRRYG